MLTMPFASNARIPPVSPSHARVVSTDAVSRVTVVYCGTTMSCAWSRPLDEYVRERGELSVTTEPLTVEMVASSYAPAVVPCV